jgi:5'-phosphate synthase pdxT subunit
MGKLLRELDMFDLLRHKISLGLPVFGTCAGLILLAKEIVNDPNTHFAAMDIRVKRNAYGRQLGSFYQEEEFVGIGTVPMTFIRAPYIEKAGEEVEVLARVEGKIVAARQKNMLVTAFHPELTDSNSIHEYFLNIV